MLRPKKILLVVTGHDRIDATHPTGLWLEDFAVPYGEFKRAGYELVAASPRGGVTPLDPHCVPTNEQKRTWAEPTRLLQHTRRLDAMRVADFDAIFICGGHGAMFDLPGYPPLQTLLLDFVRTDKIIATLGHGAAALIHIKVAHGRSIVYGKTVTAFTDDEEREAKFDTILPFLLETRLRQEEANFIAEENWASHRQQDGKLITGQNPQSVRTTARAVVQALQVALPIPAATV